MLLVLGAWSLKLIRFQPCFISKLDHALIWLLLDHYLRAKECVEGLVFVRCLLLLLCRGGVCSVESAAHSGLLCSTYPSGMNYSFIVQNCPMCYKILKSLDPRVLKLI